MAHTKEPITHSAAGSVIDLSDEAGQLDLFAPPQCTADGNIVTDRSTAGRSDGGDMPSVDAVIPRADLRERPRLLGREGVVTVLVVDWRRWQSNELTTAIDLIREVIGGVDAIAEDRGERRQTPLHVPSVAADQRDVMGMPEDDVQSSEENNVEVMTAEGEATARPSAQFSRGRDAVRDARWPAGLTWHDALNYTSFSSSELRRWQKAGAIHFRPVGRYGAKVVMRAELDKLLDQVFGAKISDVQEDFDFG